MACLTQPSRRPYPSAKTTDVPSSQFGKPVSPLSPEPARRSSGRTGLRPRRRPRPSSASQCQGHRRASLRRRPGRRQRHAAPAARRTHGFRRSPPGPWPPSRRGPARPGRRAGAAGRSSPTSCAGSSGAGASHLLEPGERRFQVVRRRLGEGRIDERVSRSRPGFSAQRDQRLTAPSSADRLGKGRGKIFEHCIYSDCICSDWGSLET